MAKVRLTTTNYLDPQLVSNSYVSSAQAAFPVSNLYNAQRRSKVWRSNGHWEVTSANQTIVFRETAAGPDLTAFVGVGDYSSTAALCAAVKAALEIAGASTYTVSTDTSTKKLKIASNGGGGDGTFRLRWTEVAAAGFAAMTGFATDVDDTGALTYTADELKIHTDEWIKWDMGISTNPTAFILIGPRNAPIKISPSAVIKLQGNETNVWTAPSFDLTILHDDEVISLFSPGGLHTEALRYWRLQVIDPSNSNGYVEIGSLFLGIFFEPTRGAAVFPLGAQPVDRSTTMFSEGGQSFSDRRQKTERFQLSWQHLTIAEKEELDAVFDEFGTSDPLFVVLDPDLAFSTRVSKYTRYVKFEGDPQWSLETPGNFSYAMTLREEL